jgi:hypothetical protein
MEVLCQDTKLRNNIQGMRTQMQRKDIETPHGESSRPCFENEMQRVKPKRPEEQQKIIRERKMQRCNKSAQGKGSCINSLALLTVYPVTTA